MVKFGLLKYQTSNLGDEIQSIAARRFLPRIDFLVDREGLDSFAGPGDVEHRILLNGWFMHDPHHWPPAPTLAPLFISFHLSDMITPSVGPGRAPSDVLLRGPNLEYLRHTGPVGARDLHTLALLEKNQVDAYFSGCLTLTLEERHPDEIEAFIALVDLDDEVADACRARSTSELRRFTHIDRNHGDTAERFTRAERLLAVYRRAKCVITSRLHAALPCLAMGTPVLILNTQPDQSRFLGLHSIIRNGSRTEFLADRLDFKLEHPTANPEDYLPLRRSLIQRVEAYVRHGDRTPVSKNPVG